ncbi:MAG: excinuclease ABC subunit UvrA [Candidatus Omnitrophota bacterium]
MNDNRYIIIKGAREHNLKSIDLKLPRNKLIVVTGLSGSGKSSLAFDTVYAEGQRKYVESLSAYARQFLEQMQKPDVDHIEGLSPSISIQQRVAGSNPRSTVATTTEIHDYLRLLFARVGKVYCYKCSKPITTQSSQQIIEKILDYKDATPILILAPVVRGRKGEYQDIFNKIKKEGFIRCRVDGRMADLNEKIKLVKNKKHNIEVVVDRITIKEGIRRRLSDSIETALSVGGGLVIISKQKNTTYPPSPLNTQATVGLRRAGDIRDTRCETLYSTKNACIDCGISYESLEPRAFSFNSPYGACPACDGMGNKMEIDPDLVVPDRSKSVKEGAIEPWRKGGKSLLLYYHRLIYQLAHDHDFNLETPFNDLGRHAQNIILYGSGKGIEKDDYFEGIVPNLERRFRETESEYMRNFIHGYMSMQPCPQCEGTRLKKESLSVKIDGKSLADICGFSIARAREFFNELKLDIEKTTIAKQILKELKTRFKFMSNVGLDYLTLDRVSSTLSGGESQRIRLATQIGAGLVGVLYVLDEPSIGLHQKDNSKLLDTLKTLRDLGNTILVVEHDEATIRSADHIVDLGPGAGKHGGQVICSGSLKDLLKNKNSLTAKYLNGDLSVSGLSKRRSYKDKKLLTIKGASEHNLKDIDVSIPLGTLTCVTGVSGSGKSTLVDDILYRALARKFYRSVNKPGKHKCIIGAENIDKVIVIDQSPIGRTPRSNPATYTGAFGHIRELFSRLPESKIRGYKLGRFSFNVKGGRCEACEGDGVKRIEMHFLPDVYIRCQVCKGKRFNQQTLEVRYKGKSISDVLEMPIDDALQLFYNIPPIRNKLETLKEVGLGYVELGQSATTLSGGEAQRVKLAAELSKRATGKTLYMLDEPTTGLHFADVSKLLLVLHRLVDQGNTALVIEHNLDVIKSADYIIDLGPEGGEKGGELVICDTPENVAKTKSSYTGAYLKNVLK